MSPWDEVRAECPDMILVRVINIDKGAQAFVEIPRSEKTLAAGAEIYDGATVITPRPEVGFDAEYKAAVIRTADAAWQRSRGPAA